MLEKYRPTMPPEVKDAWARDAEARIAELEKKRKQLTPWLSHSKGCYVYVNPEIMEPRCTCGLESALRG